MRRLLLALAATAALATAASAQTATATTTIADMFLTAKPTDILSYNLIGLNIQNGDKENIGEIKDLIISNGQLAGYIVSVGGFLGMGERYVIVSPASVKVTYSEADKKWTATMAATKDELKTAPEFKYEGRWAK
ncbi:PRC-barrel domain-containing protein [Rhizobium sp. SYY.PMSO]|uniref:PRC-barrel domain-containing protein n=1 Tax=Rhizobium sp. SYY.PMSO TaxID=3382192 RepID=UPI000DDFD578